MTFEFFRPILLWLILPLALFAMIARMLEILIGPFWSWGGFFKNELLPVLRCFWRGLKARFKRSDPECAATEYQDCSSCPGYEICHREEVK